MTRNEFIGKVASDCVSHGFSIKILQKKHFKGYSGWFDAVSKELVCAYKTRNGFETLIHEYNHFLQWKNRKKFWKECRGDDNPFLTWISGEELKKNVLHESFEQAVRLERDCEMRSIQCIKKHDLDVDVVQYAQEANAYLFSYFYILKNRDWPPRKVYNRKLIDKMPKTILSLDCYLKGVDKNGKDVMLLYGQ